MHTADLTILFSEQSVSVLQFHGALALPVYVINAAGAADSHCSFYSN
jgi:hypothetical protein